MISALLSEYYMSIGFERTELPGTYQSAKSTPIAAHLHRKLGYISHEELDGVLYVRIVPPPNGDASNLTNDIESFLKARNPALLMSFATRAEAEFWR
jgi:hypothetical protein